MTIPCRLDVVVAPDLLETADLGGAWCAVIDVLRASTTIVTAIASGARSVRPCAGPSEALELARVLPEGEYLLAGETAGRRVPGFHLGNSPLEYLDRRPVEGKTIVLTTTNGTPLLRRVHSLSGTPVHVAALVNLSAVSRALTGALSSGRVEKALLVCAGQDGRPGAEDILCAGVIVAKVREGLSRTGVAVEIGDGALVSAGFAGRQRAFHEVLAGSEHGRYLEGIGFAADVEFAARAGFFDVVPVFDGETITA